MRFLHVLKRKRFVFLNIFLFSYVFLNFFDGDRGFLSYIEKKNEKENLVNKKHYLTKKLNQIEHKNELLSNNLNFDYLDILIRNKLKIGKQDEVIIKLND